MSENSLSRTAYLHLLLANLLSILAFYTAADYRERDFGTKVEHYIYDHAYKNITLNSAAHNLGVSKSRLFAPQFHVNFRRFINAIRTDKAIILMRAPI